MTDYEQSSLTGGTVEEEQSEIITSAHVGRNADVFSKVLELHVPDGAQIADVTFGEGVFWKQVDPERYDRLATDIDSEKSPTGESVDARDLPYEDDSLDALVADPPYAEGYFRRNKDALAGHGSHSSFREAYTSMETDTSGSKYHQAVLDLYLAIGAEAKRVLKPDGVFIAKVQDEVSANTQELTHIQITNGYEDAGFYTKDLFVVVQNRTPNVVGMDNQVHARKNHSFFMVYINGGGSES